MKRIVCCLLAAFVMLEGCGHNDKEARQRLDSARTLFERDELFAAKSRIDSLRILHPKAYPVLKEGLMLMRQIEMKEARRNIAFCDSLLPVRQQEAEQASRGFVLEQDSAYQEIGNYVWKQQIIEQNTERCYLRCGVNRQGEMYLASVYFGNRPIEHTGVRVVLDHGLYAHTASVPYDGGVNYRFKDGGNYSEIVTYRGNDGVDAVKFVYDNRQARIKMEYTGGKSFSIYLTEADKQALMMTYHLAILLTDVKQLTDEKNKSLRKVAYLESKLNP